MIFKSFLIGFTAYVFAVIYNLLEAQSLKIVFINGIKFLFTVTIIAFGVQLIFSYFSSKETDTSLSAVEKSQPEKNQVNSSDKEQKIEKSEAKEEFSPLNPPEIEYEQQKEE